MLRVLTQKLSFVKRSLSCRPLSRRGFIAQFAGYGSFVRTYFIGNASLIEALLSMIAAVIGIFTKDLFYCLPAQFLLILQLM